MSEQEREAPVMIAYAGLASAAGTTGPDQETESRGGVRPDWDRARPGEPLPQQDDPELHDPPGNGGG